MGMTEEMVQDMMDRERYYEDLARYCTTYDDEMCEFDEDAPAWNGDGFVA